jgi:hypothetical protein
MFGTHAKTLAEHGANDMSKADDGWWDFWGGGWEEGGGEREKGNITLSFPPPLFLAPNFSLLCWYMLLKRWS